MQHSEFSVDCWKPFALVGVPISDSRRHRCSAHATKVLRHLESTVTSWRVRRSGEIAKGPIRLACTLLAFCYVWFGVAAVRSRRMAYSGPTITLTTSLILTKLLDLLYTINQFSNSNREDRHWARTPRICSSVQLLALAFVEVKNHFLFIASIGCLPCYLATSVFGQASVGSPFLFQLFPATLNRRFLSRRHVALSPKAGHDRVHCLRSRLFGNGESVCIRLVFTAEATVFC